uniref:DNA-directed RNA polymerase subunit beta n=1 Tax=Trithuria filamentosa TaxID=658028 RepID=V9PW14_9MAGN|nr:RNA polymerase beta subunit [Trithuria filamentosa]
MFRDARDEEMFTIPGFSQIQFQGFSRFIDEGLMEELSQFPNIEDPDQEIEFKLFGESYELVEPFLKERDAVYAALTYSSALYVPAGFIGRTGGDTQKQTILIGRIPQMTSLGTFIVNGIHRIVVNQILQRPGIYYSLRLEKKEIVYTGTIISDWGGRSKLEIDGKKRIWARVGRKEKISILVLSSAMGSNLREILANVCYPEILLSFPNKNNDERERILSKENAILEFYQKFVRVDDDWDLVVSDSLCEKLQEKFFKQRCELGIVGRQNLNQRLNLNIPQNITFLLPSDVLAAVNYLIGFQFGMGTLDDMHHLKNKRIRSVGDLLQDQLRLALVRLEKVVEESLCEVIWDDIVTPPKLVITRSPLTRTYQSFFGQHPLSQVFDQTNPLSQLVHGRKYSFLGPGGLTADTASSRPRDIHPSYYGRICPIDTSEGIKVGLIGSLAIHARIGDWGWIDSPFYEISERSKEEQMVYLSPRRDEYYRVGTGNSLALNRGIQEEEAVPAQYRQEFLTIAWEQIQLRNISPLQYFSLGASLIPFMEHNDANRALMGSNMQRQAVPLYQCEKCIVGTGLEGQVALDSGNSAIAEGAGKIIYTDAEKILILSGNGDTITIPLVVYQRSNQNTWMHQKSQVYRKKYLKKGQILADGAATFGGELALGKNISVAYMPWEGYNFEDAVLISERLVYDDIYTSFHIRKYEIQTYVTNQGPEKITNEIPGLAPYFLRNLDRNGIVMLGSWVQTDDVLVGKLTPLTAKESLIEPEDRLLRAILDLPVSPVTKETSLTLPIGGTGRVIDVSWFKRSGDSELIRVYVLQKRKIQVGDKVAGRHGNKGVISKILPRQDMPYFQDGTPVDMVLNPLGVPSRMNVGQILECSLGLAGSLLDRHYRITPFDERYEQEASRKLVFSELYEASKQTSNPWVFEPEYPGKSIIFDGRTGDPFQRPVLIGKSYILKLIHQVDDKIHARSTGPYASITQQAVKGRKKLGGQRVGEMEVWALEGFGVAHILQEMLTYKSDHRRARRELLGTIIFGGTINPEGATESFRLLVRELRSLSLELNHFLVSEKNFEITRKEV